MQINPISFTNRYRSYHMSVDDAPIFKKEKLFTECAGGQVIPEPIYPNSRGYYPKLHGREVYLIGHVNCPNDVAIHMFQGYCKQNGIKYVKEGDQTLLDADGIRRRIVKGQGSRNVAYLATLDSDKFEEAMGRQKHSNLEKIEEDYLDPDKRKIADDFILSGFDIPAPVLYLTPRGDKTADEIAKQIKNEGIESIDDDALEVKFDKITDREDQCMYCVMKKFGFRKFPVCVMEDTYKIGEAAGFITPYERPKKLKKRERMITTW